MVLDDLMASKQTILGVMVDPAGKDNLDISYAPECITPEVLKRIRGMDESAPQEDAIREILVNWGLEWNMTNYVTPGEGDPTAEVTLSSGRKILVKADAQGNAVKEPVPATFDGMKVVPLKALFATFKAIQDDARPKDPSNAS